MGDRKATIRLNVKTDGFKRGMKDAEAAADKAGKGAGDAIADNMNKGAKAGFAALKGMFDSIKTLAGTAAGLLGGIGVASLTQGAIDAQKQFKAMAFNVEDSRGKLIKWRDLQRDVQRVAVRTKVDVDKLGAGFKAAFQETGDVDFAKQTLEAVALTSRESGESLEDMGKSAGVLQQKFGLTSAQVGDGLVQMVNASKVGGASFRDLAEDLAEIGGKAKTLGLQGPEGLKKMLGFLNLAKQETGNFQQAMTALPQIFDQIIERTSEGVVKSSGKIPIKVQAVDAQGNPKDPFAIIQDIIKQTKGDAAKLGEFGFGGEGLQTLLGIAKGFRTELAATGGDVDAASASFAKRLDEAAGATGDFADVQKSAADETPADQIQAAINRLKVAFTQPKMINAIEKLAQSLPKLADGLATVLDFILSNPLTSGSILAGGSVLKAGGGAAIQAAMTAGGKSAAGDIGGAIKDGGSAFANTLKGSLAALAIPAIAAAVEQMTLLVRDLEDLQKDQKDTDLNLLENAERQGLSGTVRAATAEEKFSSLFESGFQQLSDQVEITRDPTTGKEKTRRLTKLEVAARKRGPETVTTRGINQLTGATFGVEEAAADKRRERAQADTRAAREASTGFSRLRAAVGVEEQLGRRLTDPEETKLTQRFEGRKEGQTQGEFVAQFVKNIGKESSKTTAAVKQVSQPIVQAIQTLGTQIQNEGGRNPKPGSADKDD